MCKFQKSLVPLLHANCEFMSVQKAIVFAVLICGALHPAVQSGMGVSWSLTQKTTSQNNATHTKILIVIK